MYEKGHLKSASTTEFLYKNYFNNRHFKVNQTCKNKLQRKVWHRTDNFKICTVGITIKEGDKNDS